MHYTVRNLSFLSFFLTVINFLCGIVTYLHVYIELEDQMFNRPVICLFLISAIALFIVHALISWFVFKDSDHDSQEMLENNAELKQQIADLQKQINALKYQIKS